MPQQPLSPPLAELQADWPAISRLLDEALALAHSEREAWLTQLPADVAGLKSTLVRLLAVHGGIETGDFMRTLPKLGSGAVPLPDNGAPQPGSEVGPWRLLREIGEGGMGSVWLAERADGAYQRQVALKLPRLTWAGGLAERMARERDILATLEHPRIARLYDAGVDAPGRPWLALEYVQGQALDVHAKAKGLSVRQRVELLLQVCDAVAYAHSRLVIHRDLKPSNILVTDDGQVKLLDFGIARLLQGDAAHASALTELQGRVLTLDYASPEQVRGEPLTTATDVYSLGVVAYQLLAGCAPYRLKRGSRAELEEAIADADAPPAASVAPEAQAKALRGDIDAILNKSLKKRVEDRYRTVSDLAADLLRHLRNEPVSAQPDTLAYRSATFLRRHRARAVAAVAVTLALLAGTAVSLGQARRADAERVLALQARSDARQAQTVAERQAEIAQAQRALAEQASARSDASAARALAEGERAQQAALAEQRAAAQARERGAVAAAVQRFMTDLFKANTARQADPQKARTTTARELLDIGAERVERDLRSEPAARSEAALLLSSLYGELGLDQRSLDLARIALEAARQMQPAAHPAEMAAMARVLEQARLVGKAADLDPLRVQAEALLRRSPASATRETTTLLRKLAALYEHDRPQRSLALAAQATALARRAGDFEQLQGSLSLQARAAVRLDRSDQAEALLKESLQVAARVGTTASFDLVQTRAALAEAQSRQLKFGAALATLQQALAEAEREGGADHIDVLQLQMRMATPLVQTGDLPGAVALLERVEAVLRRQGTQRELVLSLVLADLGLMRTDLGRLQAAEEALTEAMRLRERLRPGSDAAAAVRENFAKLRLAQGMLDDAGRLLDESERIRTVLGQRSGQLGWDRLANVRAALARGRGDVAEAERWAAQLTGAAAATSSVPSLSHLQWLLLRATLALDAGQPGLAWPYLQQLERRLAPLRAQVPLAVLEAPYRLQCGRLALMAGAGKDEAERQFALGAAHLRPEVLSAAPLRREQRLAQGQGVADTAALPAPALCPAST